MILKLNFFWSVWDFLFITNQILSGMSKKSIINRNLKRQFKSNKLLSYRTYLKKKIYDKSLSLEDRIKINMQIWSLSRNSAPSRIRNRDTLTGRPRGYYRYFKLDRISIRNFGRQGLIPGLRSSSW